MCDISSHTAGNNLIEQMTHLPLLYFSASVDSSAEVGNLFFPHRARLTWIQEAKCQRLTRQKKPETHSGEECLQMSSFSVIHVTLL